MRSEGHVNLSEIGLVGQRRLSGASVLCVGVGGLGCPASLYLTAAGIGKLGLVDPDKVEESNLQRQILFTSESIGKLKVDVAKAYLQKVNPATDIVSYPMQFTDVFAEEVLPEYDLVIDATDNFEARVLINSFCLKKNRPMISGSIYQFEGHLAVLNYQNGPCYECLFPVSGQSSGAEDCSLAGVFSPLLGQIGAALAGEVIKLTSGMGTPLQGKLLIWDAWSLKAETLGVLKNPNCLKCDISRVRYAEKRKLIPKGISSQELLKLIKVDPHILLFDLRAPTSTEFQIPRSRRISLGELLDGSLEIKDLIGKQLVTYCASEHRAQRASEFFGELGLSANYLIGGIKGWLDAQFPLERVEF